MADYTITLKDAGPDPEDLPAQSGRTVDIKNAMSSDTTVTTSRGLLNPSPGTIKAGATWSGRVGNTSGRYEYETPGPTKGTRSGRITIS